MFTSNGLMCLSGVTKWRMFLSAMASSRGSSLLSRRFGGRARDFRAVIEPRAEEDVQTRAAFVATRHRGEPLRLQRRSRERKAGRTPGALPDAVRAGAIHAVETGGDGGAREPPSALERRIMVAEHRLQLLDRGAEGRDVAFRKPRQRLHQDEPAQARRLVAGEWRERRECGLLVGAVDALAARIEHDEDAPVGREREAADDRRRRRHRAVAAIDQKPTMRERSDADAGARAALKPDR